MSVGRRTRVDELLSLGIPSFLLRDPLLNSRDLMMYPVSFDSRYKYALLFCPSLPDQMSRATLALGASFVRPSKCEM